MIPETRRMMLRSAGAWRTASCPVFFGLIALLSVFSSGCAKPEAQTPDIAYADLLSTLANPLRIATLNTEAAEIASSVDLSGGNNDFNNFAATEGAGRAVLVDLKGPGLVTRFWITGGKGPRQRLQFYFDDEETPRIDASVSELRAGKAPFFAPLSRYEQSCWWTYVPMPYNRRLRVVAETENFTHQGWPRLFYQVNYSATPGGATVATFPVDLSAAEEVALDAFSRNWASGGRDALPDMAPPVTIEAGAARDIFSASGPGVLRALALEVEDKAQANATWVSLFWDGADEPSLELPLPLLGGRVWLSPRFQSTYFGETNGVTYVRYPMPFARHARVQIQNRSNRPLTVSVGTDVDAGAWRDGLGYLHAVRRHSTPSDRGTAHTILEASGRGKYVGCVLGVAGQEPSWWVLEGDEAMWADSETAPGWHGTGLEDYFNGAWYYKYGIAREMSGLTYKRAFSTMQYRLHRDDARGFNNSMRVTMERGPDQASIAWMESLAFCYLAQPSTLAARLPADDTLENPADRFESASLMTSLASFERRGDSMGALERLERFLKRYPDVAFAPILRLRRIAYREQLEGIAVARPLYEAYLQNESDANGLAFCKLLLWFHENPSNAFVSLFSGNPARVSIDGNVIGEAQHPQAFMVFPVTVAPGTHVLGVEAAKRQSPDWVHVGLRTHDGIIGTSADWRSKASPVSGWNTVGFDDSSWPSVDLTLREGPPPAPAVATSPHPFVGLQSVPVAVWASDKPAPGYNQIALRREFSHGIATDRK